jgi:hypothetical protein
MRKEETIRRYSEAAYEKPLEQDRERKRANLDMVREINYEISRKGGKYYEKHLKYQHTGLPGERNKIRVKHANKWCQYKKIIAPDSQIHHEWVPETAEYLGVALVEKDQHMHGIIDVIKILDGEITLLTEEEIREQEVSAACLSSQKRR